jgi:hypothetical protein
MATRRFLQWGLLPLLGAMLACASDRDRQASVPACPGVAASPPAEEACDPAELAAYTSELSDWIAEENDQALVRIEFDDASRVRSVCVDEKTGSAVGKARREIAAKLLERGSLPTGPQCVAGRRIELNRYEAKLAEVKRAQGRCSVVLGQRMKALRHCDEFAPDWILYDRVGVTRPYLYVQTDPARASAGETLVRCERAARGFEEQSACIEADGFELLTPPPR